VSDTIIATVGSVRIMETKPCAYRLIKCADGVTRLQGAYRWEEGDLHGTEWRTIPTVDELTEVLS
jgi:hypothetical protein